MRISVSNNVYLNFSFRLTYSSWKNVLTGAETARYLPRDRDGLPVSMHQRRSTPSGKVNQVEKAVNNAQNEILDGRFIGPSKDVDSNFESSPREIL